MAVAPPIVGAIVGAILGALLNNILPTFLVKFGEISDVQTILIELNYIQDAIQGHIQKRKHMDCLLENWIEDLRNLACDIEDCTEWFQHLVLMSQESGGGLSFIRRGYIQAEVVARRPFLVSRMSGLMDRAVKIRNRFDRYNLDSASSAEVNPAALGPVHMRDAELDLLRLMEMQLQTRLKVITIVGFGCLGTNSLAKQFYESDDALQFRLRVRVSAKDHFAPRVLADILEAIQNEPDTTYEHQGDFGEHASAVDSADGRQADSPEHSAAAAVNSDDVLVIKHLGPIIRMTKRVQQVGADEHGVVIKYAGGHEANSSKHGSAINSTGEGAAINSTNGQQGGAGEHAVLINPANGQQANYDAAINSINKQQGDAAATNSNIAPTTRLRSILANKRCLIIIEDVNTKELHNIIAAFPWADGVGSRIIVTTTIQSNTTCCQCGDGTPLAVDSTTKFLKVGELSETGLRDDCLRLAETSYELFGSAYNGIPMHGLPGLLLYFSMFPRDHPVRRNPLIRKWLAEGLVFEQKENTGPVDIFGRTEDVALTTLRDINIIMPIQVSNNGKVKTCQPPLMMLDYISRKCRSQKFISLLCHETPQQGFNPVRRLSVHPSSAANNKLRLPKNLSCLRTLAVFLSENHPNNTLILDFDKYKLLRVLHLKECPLLNQEHVKKLCHLLLLKYLSLGDTIGEVPKEIANLELLETLEMRKTEVVTVPIEVIQLPSLKNLIGMFVILQHGYICPNLDDAVKFLSKRSKLERLSGFVIDYRQGFPQLMSHMVTLRKVKIWCKFTAGRENMDLLKEGIKKFIAQGTIATNDDRRMSIDFQECSIEASDQFMVFLQARGRLTSLKLSGKLKQLPHLDSTRNAIVELCLSWTNVRWEDIPDSIRNMQSLKRLKLVEHNLGCFVISNQHFLSLSRMCLVGVESLHDITIEDGALPALVSLHILCKNIDLPPSIIGGIEWLDEVALHSDVAQETKDEWLAAARTHSQRPNVLFVQGPVPPTHITP